VLVTFPQLIPHGPHTLPPRSVLTSRPNASWVFPLFHPIVCPLRFTAHVNYPEALTAILLKKQSSSLRQKVVLTPLLFFVSMSSFFSTSPPRPTLAPAPRMARYARKSLPLRCFPLLQCSGDHCRPLSMVSFSFLRHLSCRERLISLS